MSLETSGLVDLLDRLLDTGVSAAGDVTLAVAGIDLVHLQLKALLASVDAEERDGPRRQDVEWLPPPRRRRRMPAELPERIDTDPERLERGLAQLVLVVVDLLREVMERQAIRRMQGGKLTRAEIEKLSEAFEALDDRLDRLYAELGVTDDRPAHLELVR
jgi:Gas vesicle protein K/Gas vesicle protein